MKIRARNSIILAGLVAVCIGLAAWGVASAATPFHNQADCTICHDPINSTNLSNVKNTIAGEAVVFTTLPAHYANATGTKVCEVCHTLTDYYRTDGTSPGGEHHFLEYCTASCHTKCNEFVLSIPDTAVHRMHTSANAKVGNALACLDCHLNTTDYTLFKDGQNLANTTACNPCHSPGGAFDGVNTSSAVGVKVLENYTNGVYESDGVTLKAGKGKWCATCHDAAPSVVDSLTAGNVAGNNTSYGFYVNGHGTTGTYNATLHDQNGPGYGCTVCHDASQTHISGVVNDARLVALIGDSLNYTTYSSEVCLDCHVVGQSVPGEIGFDAVAEAQVHSGGVSLDYNTAVAAPDAFPSYGDSANYVNYPGYQCADCHDLHGTQKLAMMRGTLDGKLGGVSNAVAVGGFESTDADLRDLDPSSSANNGVCDACHTSAGQPHPDTGKPGNHNWGNTGASCVASSCHTHDESFVFYPHTITSGCDLNSCHGVDGSNGTVQSHSTHTETDADDLRGPKAPMVCSACHNTSNYSLFIDGNPIGSTTACNGCHSADGASGAKSSWAAGVYETDGTLKSGKETWCATCHDASPATMEGQTAPNVKGDNSTYGYYVTGHGKSGTYNATGLTAPAYVCTVCHNSALTHIRTVGSDPRLETVASDTLNYTLATSEVCLDCHEVGQSAAGSLGYDATAEATVHSGGVNGSYNTSVTAAAAFPAYGNSANYATYPGYQCEDCHDLHGTQKLVMMRGTLDGKLGGVSNPIAVAGFESTDTDLRDLDPSSSANNGVCDACHASAGQPHPDTNHAGNHNWGNTGDSCVVCHEHTDSFASSGAPDTAVHRMHTQANAKIGTVLACEDCHGSNYTVFKDEQPLATTTTCNTCHSPGGAFDGVNNAAVGVKVEDNYTNGVYESDGVTLKTGKETWCATCHDAAPSVVDSLTAGNVAGNNTSYGFYVTGHGKTGAYNATLHNQNGPGYLCTVCHDASVTHISVGSNPRLETVASDGLAYTLGVSEVCLDCHEVGQSSAGSLGEDATAEATVHSGGVTGNYNTSAAAAFPAYGESGNYANYPGYQCEDCHNLHGTQKLAMVLGTLDGKLGGVSNPIAVAGFEMTDTDLRDLDPSASANNGVCDTCHASAGAPHPDTGKPGNHNQGNTGDSCVACHAHSDSFTFGPHQVPGGCDADSCHGVDGSNGTTQSHSTHTETDADDLRGPQAAMACSACHNTSDYSLFTDGNPIGSTNACNGCHSADGAAEAKSSWAAGIYETDGTLKAGKEQWCATCHDASPATMEGQTAPNVEGNNSTYGYYVTGHGASGTYNATGLTAPDYVCTVCHNSALTHIRSVGSDPRLETVASDGLAYTLGVSEVCLDCHEVGQSSAGSLGEDATAEATVHSGGVTGNYNTSAATAFPAYGDVDNYATNPGYQCEDCHDLHGTEKLAMIRATLNGYVGGPSNPVAVAGFESTDTDLRDLDPSSSANNGVCDACHASAGQPHPDTNHAGNHNWGFTGDSCVVCHAHSDSFASTMPDTGVHRMHTQANAKIGSVLACGDCHGSSFTVFKDELPLATTTTCNTCHSPGGAFDGVNNAAVGAKNNYVDGVYESDGVTLKTGKGTWCATCHDAAPSVVDSLTAGNVAGDNSNYGYYVTGHGASGMYNATGLTAPDYVCTVCHDASVTHISVGSNPRLETVASDGLAYTLGVSEVCLDCHEVGQSSAGSLGEDATAEARVHSGGVTGNYNTSAATAFPAYGESGNYGTNPGYQCEDCHDLHGTQKLVMMRGTLDGKFGGASNPVTVASFESTDTDLRDLDPSSSANNGVCDACHASAGQPHPDTNHAGNHNWGNTGDSCVASSCHTHEESFAFYPHTITSGCDLNSCHGVDGANGTVQSHSTHTETDADDLRGPQAAMACSQCHNTSDYSLFTDGNPIGSTTACNGCHSADGASAAKSGWAAGIYETDGTLKSGKETWCATCHDASPATVEGQTAPNVEGDNSTYGYYVTGHGASGTYNATGLTAPAYVCTVCHNSALTHIRTVGSDPRLETVASDGLAYTLATSEVCLDCHEVGQSAAGSLGEDASAEATVHSGGVNGNYNTSAAAAFPAYGESGNYATNPGYQCEDCHDLHGTEKLVMMRGTLDGKFGGVSNPVTVAGFESTDTDLRDLDPSSSANNGVCDACHASAGATHPDTAHSNNHNWGNTGDSCVACHEHSDTFAATPAPDTAVHRMHTADSPKMGSVLVCQDCHGSSYTVFKDEQPLSTTTTCNTCHSPGGAFDGVNDSAVGVKNNYLNGVYEADGVTLKAGKGDWCLSCHDDDPGTPFPTNESSYIDGVYAPNIAGDNSVYGYYVTGHKLSCANCHDNSKEHIDANPRTYYAASNPNNYQAGYRLAGSMTVPKPAGGSREHAALCLGCHNADDLLGSGFSKTNFNDGSHNHHSYHYSINNAAIYDSDFDGTLDSGVSCVSCHNVHGAPNSAMIRHGELMSTPGTTDKVPALNFTYITGAGNDPYAAVEITTGGDMQWGTGGFTANNVCNDCHVLPDLQVYMRTGKAAPKVLDSSATPETVSAGVGTPVLFTASVWDSDDNVSTVTINLSAVGGSSTQAMYDDGPAGGHGDAIADDDVYSIETTVDTMNEGGHCLAVTATDSSALTGENSIAFEVINAGDIVVDDADAVYVGTWTPYPDSQAYFCSYRYAAAGSGSTTATFTPDLPVGGTYRVWAWWPASSSKASNAPYTINYNGGSARVTVNQEANGGQWNLLGTYVFVAGTSGNVVLSNDANEYVAADAVKFEYLANPRVISGQITENSVGVQDVQVALTGSFTDTKETDTGGNYSFIVADGTYTVTPSKTGYNFTPASRQVLVSGADVPNQDFTATLAADLIVDNPQATFVGSWGTYTAADQYGSNFRYIAPGDGSKTATWTPNLPVAGTYRVLAWWTANPGRPTNAPYTINYYNGGSAMIEIDQTKNAGQWNVIGVRPFDAGTSGSVVLTNGCNGLSVCADAMRFELLDPGAMRTISGQVTENSAGLANARLDLTGSKGYPTKTSGTGNYSLIVTDDGSYTVTPTMTGYNFTPASRQVLVSGADVPNQDFTAVFSGVVVDNTEATFVGTWGTYNAADQYGSNFRYTASGDGSATATFTPNLPFAGTYKVLAWWTYNAGRPSNAPYTVNYSGGSVTVEVNQQVNAGQWNLISVRYFEAGTSGSVVQTNGCNGTFVCADAVKFELIDPADVRRISGQITEDSVGLVNVSVALAGTMAYPTKTISNGNYEFIVTPGSYTVTPSITGYDFTPSSRQVVVSGVDVTGQDFTATFTGVVVDNTAATFVGTWSTYTAPDQYGSNFRYTASADGSKTATWTPNLPFAGTYKVLAWWTYNAGRPSNVPYTITYDGGSATVEVNQQVNAGQWNLIGVRYFAAGTSGSVMLTNACNGTYVCADAVKFEVIDPSDVRRISGQITEDSVGLVNVSVALAGTMAYPTKTNINGNYEFIVTDGTYTVTPSITGYDFTPSSRQVVVSGVDVTGQDFTGTFTGVVVDNTQATFAGAWKTYNTADQYGSNFHYIASGDGSATATFTPNLPFAGTYKVLAWWTYNAGRPSNAPYTITYSGGSVTVVEVNQQVNAGQWNLIGVRYFEAGTSGSVKLTNACNGTYVCADAVKFEVIDPSDVRRISGHITESSVGLANVSVGLAGTMAYPTKTSDTGYYEFIVTDGTYTVTPSITGYDFTPSSRQVVVSGVDVTGQDFTATFTGVVVDNTEATFVGTWSTYTAADQYGSNFRYTASGSGSATATFTPNLPFAGTYKVLAWWTYNAGRPTNVPYTITYDGGSATVEINQKINAGQWNLIGVCDFAAGTSGSVKLTNGCNGTFVCADAVKFEVIEPSDKRTISGQITENSVGLANVRVELAGTMAYPTKTTGSGNYAFIVTDGTYTVTPSATGYTFTPASRQVPVSGADVPGQDFTATFTGIVVDNTEATFVGTWGTYTAADQYGSNFRYIASGSGTATATWRPNLPFAGNYRVYAWWAANSGRPTNAPYVINYNGGSVEVRVSQQINGGQWNELTSGTGPVPFVVGTSGNVVLRNDANNAYVCADAVWLELVP